MSTSAFKSQLLPRPHSSVSGKNVTESTGTEKSLIRRALAWRPTNVLESLVATVSRYTLRLINQNTGEAYSANELLDLVRTDYAVPSIPVAPVSGFTGVSFNATAVAYHTLTGNSTVTFADLAPGKVVEVLITEPNGSGWGINWPAGVTWLPGVPGNPTPSAPKYLRLISTTSAASGVIGLVLSA